MNVSAENPLDELRLDKSHFSVARLTDPDDALEYWLSRPIQERLQALERLRMIAYDPTYAAQGIQRVLEVVQLEQL